MVYDTSQEYDAQRCLERVTYLIGKKKPVEVTDRSIRSLRTNSYLHLILGALAMEVGETLEYVKVEYFKKHCNADIFVVSKFDRTLGREVDFVRSSKDITQEDMSRAIDRFKRFAADNGYILPDPDDLAALQQIEVQMGRMRNFL